jgi:MFS family permease
MNDGVASGAAGARDIAILFTTRAIRLLGYGGVSVVLVLHLADAGFGGAAIGALLTAALLGDAAVSLWLTARADRWGRRRTLVLGAMLMALAGLAFAGSRSLGVLLAAAAIGVLSPGGKEAGPFLAVEQSALAERVPAARRTALFAWYHLTGSLASALGAFAAGWITQLLLSGSASPGGAYRGVMAGYAVCGFAMAALFAGLSASVETRDDAARGGRQVTFGLHRSRGVVFRLSALFALDAFGGGFILQSIVAYWFHTRFGVEPAALGTMLAVTNLLAGVSGLVAARIAARVGLIRTMVFTHLPSNVLLLLIPLVPDVRLAVGLYVLRSSIAQMDVPTRQSYTLAVVDPDERSAAAGITGIARSLGAAAAPLAAGLMITAPGLAGLPFFVGGGVKIVYDLLLFHGWRHVRPPEER